MNLKKIFPCFALILLTSRANAGESVDLIKTKVQTFEKISVSLTDKFTGELLVLDFWASWCEPCKESLPFYQELQKKHGARGLQVLAVSVDEDIQDASSFVSKNKLTLTFLWDPNGNVARSLSIHALPSTLIVDKSGKILHRERGFTKTSKTKIEEQLLKLLKKAP